MPCPGAGTPRWSPRVPLKVAGPYRPRLARTAPHRPARRRTGAPVRRGQRNQAAERRRHPGPDRRGRHSRSVVPPRPAAAGNAGRRRARRPAGVDFAPVEALPVEALPVEALPVEADGAQGPSSPTVGHERDRDPALCAWSRFSPLAASRASNGACSPRIPFMAARRRPAPVGSAGRGDEPRARSPRRAARPHGSRPARAR